MNKEEILNLIHSNPVGYLATSEGDQPRVRALLMYKADENGIMFHTGTFKDLYEQIVKNPKVELCFNDFKSGVQVRVSGVLEAVESKEIKDEILNSPSRGFLREWVEDGSMSDFYKELAVFNLKNCKAVTWTMKENFADKKIIEL